MSSAKKESHFFIAHMKKKSYKDNMKFRRLKGVTEEIRQVVFHDLECLELKDTKDNRYHYELLKNNLRDLLG